MDPPWMEILPGIASLVPRARDNETRTRDLCRDSSGVLLRSTI